LKSGHHAQKKEEKRMKALCNLNMRPVKNLLDTKEKIQNLGKSFDAVIDKLKRIKISRNKTLIENRFKILD
jgi:hypothetical protein